MNARRRTWFAASVLVVGSLVCSDPATARPPAGGWQDPTLLSAAGMLAHVAAEGDATVVAWTDDRSVVVSYRAPTDEWETTDLGEGTRPRVAVNAGGDAVAVWQRTVDGRPAISLAVRPAAGTWTEPTTLPDAGRFPTPAISETGTVRVLALRWATPTPARTDVHLFRLRSDDSAARRVLNDRQLKNTASLRRSLTLTTDPSGRAVAGWLCPARDLFTPGDPRRDGWVCLHYPRSGNDFTERSRSGRYAVSAPMNRPIFLATPAFAVSEIEPGSVYSEYWGSGRTKASQVTLDVDSHGGGTVSWQAAEPDGRLWIAIRRSHSWRSAYLVARQTHGLSGATFAEPDTGLAFWRTDNGRLTTASKVGKSSWQQDTSRLGQHVERAQLTSNRTGDAVLAWSSTTPGGAGVYVAVRPAA